jgi:acetyl-CoA C-acetyltransferase
MYGMVAMRHMHEYGTTAEQLAWIKVAASHHAQHNPHAMLRDVVTVEDVVLAVIADPLHRLDCCVVSDGGGALVVTRPEIARSLARPLVQGAGRRRGPQGSRRTGRSTCHFSAAPWSGPRAFEEAGVRPADIQYAVDLRQLHDHGADAARGPGLLRQGPGRALRRRRQPDLRRRRLPFNTDGGGLCNNHPANRGGITKVIEAVRQLRGEAHPAVQVPDCRLALAQGTGGLLGGRHASATLILERA